MGLEELNPGALVGLQREVGSREHWAERNGVAFGIARVRVYRYYKSLRHEQLSHLHDPEYPAARIVFDDHAVCTASPESPR